jgi:Rhs element Vgr protein
MPAPSPEVAQQTDLTTFSVKSAGKEMTSTYEVYSITIASAVNSIPSARIVLLDGSAPEETFVASESDDFAPGTQIDIEVGYNRQNTPVFSGIIVKQGLRQCSGGPSQLVLECRSQAIKMTAVRKNADHGKPGSTLTDSELMESLILAHGLTAKVTATTPSLPWIIQFNCSDWDFLVIRAQINGMLVLADGKNIAVKAPDFTQKPALSVTYGIDIMELQTEIDAATQWSGVQCSAWDPAQQAMASASASPTGVNTLGSDTTSSLASVLDGGTVNLASSTPLPSDQLQAWASAEMLKSELAKISGRIRFQGSSKIAPGGLLQIAGLGKRFNGKGFVGAVTHLIENGNWTTEVALGMDPAWFAHKPDVSGPPVGAQLPPVRGLQLGVVKKIDGDPAGERRVQVALPVVAAAPALVWARLGSFYATKDGGAFFYPEIDDEVVLGFLDNDPRYPVILGSLYSSSRPGPPATAGQTDALTPDADNSTKAIITHGGLRCVLDDKNQVITLQTPGGNQLVLSDKDNFILIEDGNKNSIKLSSNGIELSSKSDINITADQSITEKATQNVKVTGMKISLTADTDFTAKSNATATLQASATTTIKGAMVMIN